jgi:hypothetical protein
MITEFDAQELWDKLDPRDRDVIFKTSHNARFFVNTLFDWKALTDEQKDEIIRWLNSKP